MVHKLASSPAIQFKGSGFYITDYAKKDYVASAKSDGGSSGEKGGAEKAEKPAPRFAEKSEKGAKRPRRQDFHLKRAVIDDSDAGCVERRRPPLQLQRLPDSSKT